MSDKVHFWSDLIELTHAKQVAEFNFCMCEDLDGAEPPYADCPREDKSHLLHGSTFAGFEIAPEVRGYRYHVGGYTATAQEAQEKLAELREQLDNTQQLKGA